MTDPEKTSQHGHETTDARAKPVIQFLVALGVILVVVMFGMDYLYRHLESDVRGPRQASPTVDTRQIPPGPRLEAEPAAELRRVREREEALLHRYEWLDRRLGVARIPIERAKELLLEKGLPYRKAETGQPSAASK
ncbi:MAG: hypothetical protein Kow00109_11330 [Acidobacteriota bacterium]